MKRWNWGTALLVITTISLQAAVAYKMFWPSPPRAANAAPPIKRGLNARIDVSQMPARGDERASLAVLEFFDFECPYCKQHRNDVFVKIDDNFVKRGDVKYLDAHYPLTSIHPRATLMATAAICAHDQDRYWDMHEKLFATQPGAKKFVLLLAEELGIGMDKFSACVENEPLAKRVIDRDMAAAKTLGIRSTPVFALGRLDGKGNLSVDTVITGAQPYDVFEKELSRLSKMAVAAR